MKNPSHHPSFKHLRSRKLTALNITMSEYEHLKTGAQHIHLDADNNENVFLVALRTLPTDSTGVAHILEHTVLCGSEKYPVRDPFFMMIRRSLNTFMNAFTSADWTAYPFASQNRKDFDNLLDVYLDAVFFSRLDPLDFAQEGHRLEFEDSLNSDSPLVYKGVVFNEMKGAMSSVSSQLWQALSHFIYPTNTYHHNSGGEPEAIPDLSYEALKTFYQVHYHPSNATFMTFGNIPALDHQTHFEDQVLHRFDRLDKVIKVEKEQRYTQPIQVEKNYAYQQDANDSSAKDHLVIGWLLSESTDLMASLEANLLASILFDNSASPLQHLLETSKLGASPSPLCGLDDSHYEMLFMCGLADTKAEHRDALEQAVIDTLTSVVEKSLPQEQIEASLHQLELRQREIGGDSYPYGLQLILNGLGCATHRGDVLAALDIEAALKDLREKIAAPSYIPQLIQKLLLNNTHRVTLTLRADNQLEAEQKAAETARLAAIKARLNDTDKQAIIQQTQALSERQQQKDDNSILPKVTLADIPTHKHYPQGYSEQYRHGTIHCYPAGTNGLSYQQLVLPLTSFDDHFINALPWYTLCLTEVGLGDQDYLSIQQRQSQTVGSLLSYYNLRNHTDDPQKLQAYVTLSSKALTHHQDKMLTLMKETIEHPRFDEVERIMELITQSKIAREHSITSNGHSLAMQAASASFNPTAYLNHQLNGLAGLQSMQRLYEQLQAGTYAPLLDTLVDLQQHLLQSEKHCLLIGEEQQLQTYQKASVDCWEHLMTQATTAPATEFSQTLPSTQHQAWITNSQVHFCAKAYPTVGMNHPDAPALCVLGGVLRNGYLHRTIREQGGAYGGGASQDNNSAAFRFYSYRDPRMTETLQDFDDSLAWLLGNAVTEQAIEESILGLIGAIDKPGSPAGDAKQEFHALLSGRSQAKRQQLRQNIINVTVKDLQRVANRYLTTDKACTAVITGKQGVAEAEKLGLELVYL